MTKFSLIENGSATSPTGFVAAAVATGMKADGALDVALLVSETDCTAAGVFTRNQVVAAPVIVDRETLKKNAKRIRAVVMNAKNANACTGTQGIDNTKVMQGLAAEKLGCEAGQVLVLSTGVIGQQLPMDKIAQGITLAADNLSAAHGAMAAQAFMTTDTVAKHIAVQVPLSAGVVTIGGQAKGSGMIHPDMATMLAVVTTDANISDNTMADFLDQVVERSFNRISVDGDTSTNDSVIFMANGTSGVEVGHTSEPIFGLRMTTYDEDTKLFLQALTYVCTELAKMIVRDGEGATKFVEIQVEGADDDGEAHQIANTIATSPLVKTAFAGGDANWGRILAAAGRAGVELDPDRLQLWFSAETHPPLQVLEQGAPTAYAETEASAIFAETDIVVRLSVGRGKGEAIVWTCDMTHDYIAINADYRT